MRFLGAGVWEYGSSLSLPARLLVRVRSGGWGEDEAGGVLSFLSCWVCFLTLDAGVRRATKSSALAWLIY